MRGITEKKGKGQVKERVCIKDPWTKTMGRGRIECGMWSVCWAGDSNGGNGDNYN